jgi:hypothetical protein
MFMKKRRFAMSAKESRSRKSGMWIVRFGAEIKIRMFKQAKPDNEKIGKHGKCARFA